MTRRENFIKTLMPTLSRELPLGNVAAVDASENNRDAQFNFLPQLSSDMDISPLHPFLIISSLSMSKAERERVGSLLLLSLSLSPRMYTFFMFFMGVEVGSSPDVVCPRAVPCGSVRYSISNRLPGDRVYSGNTPNTLSHHHLAHIYFSWHRSRPAGRPRWKHRP